MNGRVSILVSAIGEESFVDGNGNGYYDGAPSDSFTNIPEPWLDENEDGLRDATEPFLDFGGNADGSPDNAWNAATDDPGFSGLLCQSPNGDCSTASETVAVFGQGVIVMSGCDLVASAITQSSIALPATIGGLFEDGRFNPLPKATKIDFSTDNGSIVGPNGFTYPNTTAAQSYSVSIIPDSTPSAGNATVTVTCPSGLTTTLIFPVTD